jgi:hypothetical protein
LIVKNKRNKSKKIEDGWIDCCCNR